MKDQDKVAFKIGVIAILAIVAMAGVMSYLQPEQMVVTPGVPGVPGVPVIPAPPIDGECKGLAQLPSMTTHAYLKYTPGTELTENIMYREVGGFGWTEIAAGSAIARAYNTQLEIMWGDCDSTPVETMHGPLMVYTYPCLETDDLYVEVRNDVDNTTQVTETEFDENSATGAQAISNGETMNLELTYRGTFETDYGNINCGELSNMIVFHYNTSNITEIDVLSVERETGVSKSWTPAAVTIPAGIAGDNAASYFTNVGYEFPVLESNNKYRVYYVVEADDTNDPAAADLLIYLFDSGYYLDNDDNQVYCGWEDEDRNEIGEDDSNDLVSNPIT